MQELEVVGTDGTALLVATASGEQYRLPVDNTLRSQLRHIDRQAESEVRVPPRIIQAHLRAGMSVDEVADLTGASREAIARFEGPVVSELNYLLGQALAAPSAQPGPNGETAFGAATTARLASIDASDMDWSCWRDEAGEWIVKLAFTASSVEHDARWSFEPKSGTLTPLSADATALGEKDDTSDRLIPRLRAVEALPVIENDGVPLASERFDSGAFDIRLDSDDDEQPTARAVEDAAIRRSSDPGPETFGQTADLLDALRRRRGERQAERTSDPDALIPLDDVVAAAAPPEAHTDPAVGDAPDDDLALFTDLDEEPAREPERREARAAKGRRGRAAMPSWDEIVFGARSEDDPA